MGQFCRFLSVKSILAGGDLTGKGPILPVASATILRKIPTAPATKPLKTPATDHHAPRPPGPKDPQAPYGMVKLFALRPTPKEFRRRIGPETDPAAITAVTLVELIPVTALRP